MNFSETEGMRLEEEKNMGSVGLGKNAGEVIMCFNNGKNVN